LYKGEIATGETTVDLLMRLIHNSLVQKYNYQWIHSTTGEISYIRFQIALKENKSLFREFTVRPHINQAKISSEQTEW
jgi:hypothetical protein